MTRCILISLILVFFYSCKESVPSGIIKPAKMQEILWDVLRADVLSQQISSRDSSKVLAEENVRLTKRVFAIHNVTEEQYQKSYSWYTRHPDKMKTILDSLNAQQIRKAALADSLLQKPLRKDTIINNIR